MESIQECSRIRKRSETLWQTTFARAADCRIEQQSAARLFASRPFWMVKVNHPAQMNGKMNCRSFTSGIACPAGCHCSLGNASVRPIDPITVERRRNIRTSNTNCSACAFTAHYATDRIAFRVFVRKRGARYRIQCDFSLGEDALPLHGAYILAPANMGFCGHLRAYRRTRHVTLTHGVCARTRCAVSGIRARISGEIPNTVISA